MESSMSLRERADLRGYSAQKSPFQYGSRKERGPDSFLASTRRELQRPRGNAALGGRLNAQGIMVPWK